MKFLLFCAILCMSMLCRGQKLIVLDQDIPVAAAKVLIKNSQGSILDFATTDSNGVVNLERYEQPALLEISHFGFQTKTLSLTVLDLTKDFISVQLEQLINNLDEILLNATPGIIKEGDTTTFNLARFRNGEERSLKELLPKLPGVIISSDNTIYYNKKPITNVLINGISIFDDNYKEPIDNLNPGKMLTIQFIENHVAESAFTKDRLKYTAMNLEFDEGFIFSGTLRAGGGVRNVYDLYANAVIADKNYSSYIDFSFDNIGRNKANEHLNSDLTTALYGNINLNTLVIPINLESSVTNDLIQNTSNLGFKGSRGTEYQISTSTHISDMFRAESLFETFFIDNDLIINRNYEEQNNVQYRVYEMQLSTKKKRESSFFKNTIAAKHTNYDWTNSNILNGNEGLLRQDYNNFQFVYNGRYEFVNKNGLVTYIQLNSNYQKQHNDYFNVNEIASVNQIFTIDAISNEFIFNKQFLKTKNRERSILIKPTLSYFQVDAVDDFFGLSMQSELLGELEAFYSYQFEDENKPNFSFELGFQYFNVFVTDNSSSFLLPRLNVKYEFGQSIKSTASLSVNNNWLNTVAPRNGIPLRTGFTQLTRANLSNIPKSDLDFNYSIRQPKLVSESSISLYSKLANRALVERLVITPESSIQDLSSTEGLTYRLGGQLKYNSLVFEKVFVEVSSDYSFSNGFIFLNDSFDRADFFLNSYSFGFLGKRSTKTGYQAELKSKLKFVKFALNNNVNVNRVYDIGLKLSKKSKNITVSHDLSLQNRATPVTYIFNDLSFEYRIPTSKWVLNLDAYNIFDIKTIRSQVINEFSISEAAYSLPGIRVIAKASYQF